MFRTGRTRGTTRGVGGALGTGRESSRGHVQATPRYPAPLCAGSAHHLTRQCELRRRDPCFSRAGSFT
ncbi:hypothetical protein APASM_1074 [Actinosynnema pretiosum subsp. pretiosum]|nr:hypothetical protein APASM_1074 [Actinosynnema pretiosum subsp. pretiosum]